MATVVDIHDYLRAEIEPPAEREQPAEVKFFPVVASEREAMRRHFKRTCADEAPCDVPQ